MTKKIAVIDGNSYYFIRLEGEEVFYSISAAQNREAVTLNVGDTVTIEHAVLSEGELTTFLEGYSLTITRRAPAPYVPAP